MACGQLWAAGNRARPVCNLRAYDCDKSVGHRVVLKRRALVISVAEYIVFHQAASAVAAILNSSGRRNAAAPSGRAATQATCNDAGLARVRLVSHPAELQRRERKGLRGPARLGIP